MQPGSLPAQTSGYRPEMVRHYKRKRDPRGRMLRAAALHAEGKSLREIAAAIDCSHQTVARDLAKWAAEQAGVSHMPVTKMPHGGGSVTPECDSTAPVIPLRRIS